MTKYYCLPTSLNHQQGAIVLVSVVLMLVMITLVTLYTGKIQFFEHSIILNSQNQRLAFSAAEAGMMRGLAELQQNKTWPNAVIGEELDGLQRFSVDATQQTLTRHSHELKLFELTSSGTSADGLANATIQQLAVIYPLLTQIPSAALFVLGGINKQGSIEVVANPNGAGEGIPLSIWSDGDIDLAQINGFTCGLQEYQDGQCQTHAYSSSVQAGADILSNDLGFPNDVFAHLFNMSIDHHNAMRDEATHLLNACNTLDHNARGVIWVEGDCDIAADLTIGSSSAPLLIFINDGNLRLGTNTHIYGLTVMLKRADNVSSYDVYVPATSALHGALVSNYELGSLAGSIRVIYDLATLQTLASAADFLRVARVPGSWHDM